jgi:hypothetical protein
MRKICDSVNDALMSEYRLRALGSSQPKGFSITSRGQSFAVLTFSDDRPSWSAIVPNRRGGVAR